MIASCQESNDNLDSVLKSKDITLSTKVCIVKAMIFPVVMYGYVSWTIKEAERWRIDAFELCMVLEKILESPLDCQEIQEVHPKGDQSWVFIGKTDIEVETPILWPPLWQRADSFEKTLMLGKIDGRRRRGWQRMKWLDGITDSMDMGLMEREAWRAAVHGVTKSQTQLSNWTELNWTEKLYYSLILFCPWS